MLSLILTIEPQAAERPRHGNGFTYTPSKTRAFKRALQLLAQPYAPKALLDGPIKLTAKFIFKRPKRPKFKNHHAVKPDMDNLLKGLKDALNGVIWTDDCRVCEYGEGTGKYYDVSGGYPRIELKIEELEDAR